MKTPTFDQLLDAGVHFGHLKSKWNPKMRHNIFMEKGGLHIIDLNRTVADLENAGKAMRNLAKSGKKIMFVSTKKQTKHIIAKAAQEVNMPFVTERWLGGMMTNFPTIRKSIKKIQSINSMLEDKSLTSITKKERLMLTRERTKLERVLGGIKQLNRLPHAVFIVDVIQEHLALQEAKKLGFTTFAMIDTNANPSVVDYSIPANDDSSTSVQVIADYLVGCIKEGLNDREKNRKSDAPAKK